MIKVSLNFRVDKSKEHRLCSHSVELSKSGVALESECLNLYQHKIKITARVRDAVGNLKTEEPFISGLGSKELALGLGLSFGNSKAAEPAPCSWIRQVRNIAFSEIYCPQSLQQNFKQ